jgi:hypothetical protein
MTLFEQVLSLREAITLPKNMFIAIGTSVEICKSKGIDPTPKNVAQNVIPLLR